MCNCIAGKAQSSIYGDRLGPVGSGKRAQQSLKNGPLGYLKMAHNLVGCQIGKQAIKCFNQCTMGKLSIHSVTNITSTASCDAKNIKYTQILRKDRLINLETGPNV